MGWDDPDSHVECNGVPFQKFHMQSIRCSIHMEARIMQALPIPFPTTLLSMVYVTRGANGVESRKIYHVPIPATTKNYAHVNFCCV